MKPEAVVTPPSEEEIAARIAGVRARMAASGLAACVVVWIVASKDKTARATSEK